MNKISYSIQIFDSNNNIVLPSDLTLHYNIHILCFLKQKNSINIYSLARIEEDKNFKCTEFIKLYDSIKIGIIVYENNINGLINHDYKKFYLDLKQYSRLNMVMNQMIILIFLFY